MNGHGCVPIKLYLQEQAEGWIWPPLAHSLSTSGLEESGWICPVQTSRQLPRVQRENNAPGITQGFLHFAHPARVQGSLDDLLSVKDNFWWVTPEFEVPAVLW